MSRTSRTRVCARCNGEYEEPCPWLHLWPKRFCSLDCYTTSKPPRQAKPRAQMPRTTGAKKRKAISPASTGQRLAVQGRACLVCRQHAGECDPAHLIDRSLLTAGQDDPRAVVPLCRSCHDLYDLGKLSLLEYLEPHEREVLAFAVARHGLLRTLQRVTGCDWQPVERHSNAA